MPWESMPARQIRCSQTESTSVTRHRDLLQDSSESRPDDLRPAVSAQRLRFVIAPPLLFLCPPAQPFM